MQADTDGVQHVTYVFDTGTDAVTVEVEHGGRSTGPIQRLEPGFWGAGHPLQPGLPARRHRALSVVGARRRTDRGGAPSELSSEHLARFVLSYVQPGALVGLRWTWPA